jgi:hypothetical protein
VGRAIRRGKAKAGVLALCLAVAGVGSGGGAWAQSPAPATARPFDDPEATMVRDVVVSVTIQRFGPAWWKVSDGDSVAWILALPPALAPLKLEWDKTLLERRMDGARALYLPPDGKSKLDGRWSKALPAWTQAHIALAAVKAEFQPQGYIEPPTLNKVLELRGDFLRKARLGFDPEDEIRASARRHKVAIFKPAGLTVQLGPKEFDDSDAEVAACLSAMLVEIETDPEVFQQQGDNWAKGRVNRVLEGPRGSLPVCMNRMLPGYSRRLIETQTAQISEALKTPGKVVAIVPMRQLLAEEGVLQRLRAEGYTVSDPGAHLSEE